MRYSLCLSRIIKVNYITVPNICFGTQFSVGWQGSLFAPEIISCRVLRGDCWVYWYIFLFMYAASYIFLVKKPKDGFSITHHHYSSWIITPNTANGYKTLTFNWMNNDIKKFIFPIWHTYYSQNSHAERNSITVYLNNAACWGCFSGRTSHTRTH